HWDLIVETAGHRSLTRLGRALTPRGTLGIVGSEGGGRGMGGLDAQPGGGGRRRWMGGVARRLRALVLSRFVGQRLRMLSSKPRQDDLQVLRELIEAGTLTPAVDRTFPLREVPEAIRYLVEGHGRGKVVITALG